MISNFFQKHSLITSFVSNTIQIYLKSVRCYKKLQPNESGNIVIIALHKLGDSVYTIPAILELEKIYKKQLHIVCFKESIPIFNLRLKNYKYYSLNREDFKFGYRIVPSSARKTLAGINPEIIIDLTGVMTSASLIFNSKAKIIVGICRKQFKSIYDKSVEVKYITHLSEIYLNVVKLIDPHFIISDNFLTYQTFSKKNYILIHPYAGWKAKEWQLKNYLELARKLSNKFNIKLIIPSERFSEDIIKEILFLNISYKITNTIDELISLISESALLIGNDSGPIHIASLVGVPTFTIYGSTNPVVHLPKGENHKYCRKKIFCSPLDYEKMCFADGGRNGCPSYECMENLSVEFVESQLLQFLDKLKSQELK